MSSDRVRQRQIPFDPKPKLRLNYKGVLLEQYYEPDFLCHEKIVVELKAVSQLADIYRAQVINYLKATRLRLGLLVNFHSHPKFDFQRIVN